VAHEPAQRCGSKLSSRIRIESSFTILFTALVVLFLLLPYFITHFIALELIVMAISAGLVAGVYALSRNRRLLTVAIVLVVLNQGLHWSMLMSYDPALVLLSQISQTVFYGFATVFIIQHLFRGSKVTTETVFAVLCGYLLLGIVWASVYGLIELLSPGSFVSGGEPIFDSHLEQLDQRRGSTLFYFSFVTLTTLGYGDVTPGTAAAGTFAALEAITGQLYIAILIARMVAMRVVDLKQ